jgi:hypothetical protein
MSSSADALGMQYHQIGSTKYLVGENLNAWPTIQLNYNTPEDASYGTCVTTELGWQWYGPSNKVKVRGTRNLIQSNGIRTMFHGRAKGQCSRLYGSGGMKMS